MKPLHFTKMHGAGNDFVIIDNRDSALSENDIIELAPEMCNRRFGVGADGMMALQPSDDPALDYSMFYRNADGSDAGMCGNGARCLALFAASLGLGPQLRFSVHDEIYSATVEADRNYVTIFFPMEVTINTISVDGEPTIYQMYAGTEHIVLNVEPDFLADDQKLRARGKELRYNPRFKPTGTNVNFIRGVSATEAHITTYEKGVENLTLACGTGAIAGALAWHKINNPASQSQPTSILAEGGTLQVSFTYDAAHDHYSNISLGGKAAFVFEGVYEI